MLRLPLALSLLIFASLYTHASEVLILKPVLKNVEGIPTADLKAIIRDLNTSNYGDLDELAERVRFTFQKYGYFKVQVTDPVMPTAKDVGEKKVVLVNLVVTAGEKYRIRDIGFGSSGVFSRNELRAAFPIKDGDVFDREKIGLGLENLRKIYFTGGHMFFSAVPETETDDAARTISLRVDLDEGPIFYAGTLTVRGEESQSGAREKLLKTWKAYEGQVFDLQTLNRFLRDLHARPAVRPEQVFEVSFDATKHLANVYIYLSRPIFLSSNK
jgi:outer membrane protein assembly factor BamA